MQPVVVRILHPSATGTGPLEAALLAAKHDNARRLAGLFEAAGATVVGIASDSTGGSFGARLRNLVSDVGDAGLVVAGSGSVPLAKPDDARAFVEAAASPSPRALANNRYSADILAVSHASVLADVPELPGDNALPRWLAEVAGIEVDDLRDRTHLAMDLDSPLDVVLTGASLPGNVDSRPVSAILGELRDVAADPRAELVIAGRTSAATLAWLEGATRCRIRALVEERGLRASSPAALGGEAQPPRHAPRERPAGSPERPARSQRPQHPRRPPRSVLGLVLDDRGPAAMGTILAELGDAAVVDSRVLLAHRLGADEGAWPIAEDRFASDLLLADRIADPWLRELTLAARDAPIPIGLGGHSLVGPGIRLVLAGAD